MNGIQAQLTSLRLVGDGYLAEKVFSLGKFKRVIGAVILGGITQVHAVPQIIPSGDVSEAGTDPAWSFNSITVGDTATGSLRVLGGATVTTTTSFNIARDVSGIGEVWVEGPGSTLTAGSNVDIAFRGQGTLRVLDGGQVFSDQGYVGRGATSDGTVVISGAGSSWQLTSRLYIGNNGLALLTVADGGLLKADGVIDVGRNGSDLDIAIVTGAGSSMRTQRSLNIGRSTGNGWLQLTDNALVTAQEGYIGREATASGRATISAGGRWELLEDLRVGYEGTGLLEINAGGQVLGRNSVVASEAGSSGTANVTGVGGLWKMSDQLTVGSAGIADMSISAGGEVQSSRGVIGALGGSRATLNMTDQGSQWRVTNGLVVGAAGNGELSLADGAQVSASSVQLGAQNTGIGLLDVSGSGALLQALQLEVGVLGTGTFTLGSGGQVRSNSAVLGAQTGSTASVLMSGLDAAWNNQNLLTIADSGAATLTLEQGAIMRAAEVNVAAQAGSSATLNLLSGGVLETAQLSKGAGSASINFNGGALRATGDQLNFLSGFEPIVLGANGLVVDTNGYEVSISTEFAASPGKLVKQGAGTLNLIGSNAFSGGTEVQAGIVQAGSAQALGTGMVTIGGAGQFAEVHMFGDVRAPQVFGGSGLPFGMLVTSQGLLTGTGVIGSTTVRSGGIISPGVFGEELATLSIDGDLTFEPGGIYEVLIDTSTGQSDLLRVRGTAVLTDGILNHDSLGLQYQRGARYEVLSAGTRIGEFADVTSDYAFLKVVADYSMDPNKVFLGFERREDVLFSDFAYTPNQKATARALDGIGVSNDVIDFIESLDVGEPAKVYDSLSGELHASLRSSLMGWDYTLAQAALQPRPKSLASCAAEPSAANWQGSNCEAASGWSARVQAVGNWQKRRGDGNAAQGKTDTGGMLLTLEAPLADSGWRAGALLGAGQSTLKVNERSSSADIEHYSAAVYAGTDIALGDDLLKLQGGLAYTRHQVSSKRFVDRIDQSLKAKYHGDSVQLFAEAGYAIAGLGAWQLEPYAGLNITRQQLGRFTEKGGFAGLNSRSQGETFTSSVLGLRSGYAFDVANKAAQISTNVGWKHVWGSRDITRSMAFNVGSPDFTIAGVDQPRNSAVLGLQAQLALDERSTIELAIGGEFGQRLREQGAELSLHYAF